MLVNRERGFGFVHIAKCAGSTIRHQLRELDDFDGRFYGSFSHPELGLINGNHLPLDILERYFPEALAALSAVTSYTICRDPADRFVSAMAQRCRSQLGREPAEMPAGAVRGEVGRVLDRLGRNPEIITEGFVYFTPQIRYVRLAGERRIDHVVPMEHIDRLFDRLERDHGLTLVRDSVWNPTVTYRFPRLRGGLIGAKDLSRRLLPPRAHARLRDLGVRLFTTPGAPAFRDQVMAADGVSAFLKEFYHDDMALHAAARAAVQPDG